MAVVQSPKKVCVVCGSDVANRPRVKDAQGRYVCQGACQAAYAGRIEPKPTRIPPPVTGESSVLDNLISSSPMLVAKNCPSCNSPMPSDGVLCTRCGFNSQTGKAIKTQVIKEKASKEPSEKKKSSLPYINGWMIFGVASVIAIGAGILPMIDIGLGLVSLGVLVVLGLAALLTAASAVYEEGETWMVGIWIALRVGQRFLARTGQGGSLLAGVLELALVAMILIFVDSRWAKALTAASCLGWITLGFAAAMAGKSIEGLVNL